MMNNIEKKVFRGNLYFRYIIFGNTELKLLVEMHYSI